MESVEKTEALSGEAGEIRQPEAAAVPAKESNVRLVVVLAAAAVGAILLRRELLSFFNYARLSEVHSYILLIPVVVAYLIYLRWSDLPARTVSFLPAAGSAALGVVSLFLAYLCRRHSDDAGDFFTLFALALCFFTWATILFYFGGRWFVAALFPLLFLLFVIPLPAAVVDTLEDWSKVASAEVADWMFTLTGTPALRNGQIFQLPGITIEVAKECSGIRSSLVLVVTSILAANMFLRTKARRVWLVASVIPLGLLRNGFRILVVSLLCVHIGPHMIDSPVHRRGGPIFFAISLVPLFALLWWLRRSESRGTSGERDNRS